MPSLSWPIYVGASTPSVFKTAGGDLAENLRARSSEEVFADHLRLASEHRFEEDIERNVPPDCVVLQRRGVFRGHDGVRELARLLAEELPDAPAENARGFALLGMAIFDAVVACFDSKYLYDLWRPVTAIHLADHDSNHKTDADANWASFVPTPPFPSYPSGHAAFGAAARRVLERTLGADGHAITLASPLVPDVVLRYSSWNQITDRTNADPRPSRPAHLAPLPPRWRRDGDPARA